MTRIFNPAARTAVARFALAALVMAALVAVYLMAAQPRTAQAAKVEANCSNALGDAQMINAAIAGSNEGDEIVITGRCLIDETIKLLGHRSYRGESYTRTELKQADGANLDAILASDSYLENWLTVGAPVSVRQLRLTGNAANNTAPTSGIILRSGYTTVQDVYVWDVGGNGIRLTSASEDGTVATNSVVDGHIVNNFIRGTGGHGFYAEDPGNQVTDQHLIGNVVSDNDLDGIHLDNVAGWLIRGNNVYGAKQNALYANRMFGTVIANNYIEPFGEGSTAGTWYGIRGTVQGGRPSTISGNTITGTEAIAGSTYSYIGLTANSGTGVVSVTGNALRFRGSGTSSGTGLDYRPGSGAGLVIASTGNAVADIQQPIFSGTNVTVTAGY